MTPSAPTTVTPGYRTTEFWGKVIVQIIGILVLTGIIHPVNLADPTLALEVQIVAGLLATVLPELFYAISRSMVKKAAVVANTSVVVASMAHDAAVTSATIAAGGPKYAPTSTGATPAPPPH